MWSSQGSLNPLTAFLREEVELFQFWLQQLRCCWHIPMKYWSICHVSVNAVGTGEVDAVDSDCHGHCAATQYLIPWHLRMTCRPSTHGSEHFISPSVTLANTNSLSVFCSFCECNMRNISEHDKCLICLRTRNAATLCRLPCCLSCHAHTVQHSWQTCISGLEWSCLSCCVTPHY